MMSHDSHSAPEGLAKNFLNLNDPPFRGNARIPFQEGPILHKGPSYVFKIFCLKFDKNYKGPH